MKRCIIITLFLFLTCLLYAQGNISTGTGFFVSGNGTIVTCAHVITDATKVTVIVNNNEYTAVVLAKNEATDTAVLQINFRPTYHFAIANFAEVSLGDKVYVLGFPLSHLLGTDIRLTDGIVSAKSGIGSDQTYFQISAPIQPGNSGGPIFNSKFEVVGVAAAKLNEMATLISSGIIPQNVNFGIKSNVARLVIPNANVGEGNVRSMSDATRATVQIKAYEADTPAGSSFQIANNTGYTVYYCYVSPSSSTEWGNDRLGSNVMEHGDVLNITSIPLGTNTPYDIKLVDKDGDSYTKTSLTLRQGQVIEFAFSDLDSNSNSSSSNQTSSNSNSSSSPNPVITIVNNTGYTIYYIHLSPVSADDWEEDVLGDDVLLDGYSINVRLATPLSVENRYDIKLTDADDDTYTKWNVTITPNMTINFNFSDLD